MTNPLDSGQSTIEINSAMDFLLRRLETAVTQEELEEIRRGFAEIGYDFRGNSLSYRLTSMPPVPAEPADL